MQPYTGAPGTGGNFPETLISLVIMETSGEIWVSDNQRPGPVSLVLQSMMVEPWWSWDQA